MLSIWSSLFSVHWQSINLMYPLVASAYVCLLIIVGIRLKLHNPASLVHLDHLLEQHNLHDRRTTVEKIGERFKLITRLQEELGLQSLLRISGSKQSPSAWLAVGVTRGALVTGGFLALDGLTWLPNHQLGFPPGLALLGLVVYPLMRFIRLRTTAESIILHMNTGVRDSLMAIVILSYYQHMNARDRLVLLSRSHKDQTLVNFLLKQPWRTIQEGMDQIDKPSGTLVARHLWSVPEDYEVIGDLYRSDMFKQLSSATLQESDRGLRPRDVYLRLADKVYSRQLWEATMAKERARNVMTVFIALMLIPLLALFGAPILSIFQAAFR